MVVPSFLRKTLAPCAPSPAGFLTVPTTVPESTWADAPSHAKTMQTRRVLVCINLMNPEMARVNDSSSVLLRYGMPHCRGHFGSKTNQLCYCFLFLRPLVSSLSRVCALLSHCSLSCGGRKVDRPRPRAKHPVSKP